MNPTNAEIRQFILSSFKDEEFELFCADYFGDAESVLASNWSFEKKAQRLIEYCQNRGLLGNLLTALQKERPQPYTQRFSQVVEQPSEAPAIATSAVTPPKVATPQPEVKSLASPDPIVLESPFQLELVWVPASEFLMGSDPAKDRLAVKNEQPQHRVHVSEFYIGKYPITNTQYSVYAKENKIEFMVPSGKDSHPVVKITWSQAIRFCEWLSHVTERRLRLPTEAEWEKAARGTDGRIYPWGNGWDSARVNGGLSRWVRPITQTTTLVGKYSPDGDSLYGASDMAGNVWEWTNSLYHYIMSTLIEPMMDERPFRVLNGGCSGAGRSIPTLTACAVRAASEPIR